MDRTKVFFPDLWSRYSETARRYLGAAVALDDPAWKLEAHQIIRVDGWSIPIIKYRGRWPSIQTQESMIDSAIFDLVNLRNGTSEPGWFMFVDDNGHARGKPKNLKGTELYQAQLRPEFRDRASIVGDVIVMKEGI